MRLFSKIPVVIFFSLLVISAAAYAHHKPGHEDQNSKQNITGGNKEIQP